MQMCRDVNQIKYKVMFLVNFVYIFEYKIYQQEKNLKINEIYKNLGEGLVNI